jgi:hypothetical protein
MTATALPKRWPTLVAACVLVVALAACGAAPDPHDLSGLWLVTREAGSEGAFGTSGTMTLAFDEGSAGAARFLGRRESGVTVCETYGFTRVGSTLALESAFLPSPTLEIDRLDDDTVILTADELVLRLTRLDGWNPVPECGTGSTAWVGSFAAPLGFWSRLNAVDSTLYVNLAGDDEPIAGFDLETRTLGPPRTYSRLVTGGVDRWVVAARSDARFYGHCACGGSVRLGYFDLDADEPIAQVDGSTAFEVPITIRHGAFHDGAVTIGGTARDGSGVNRLVTLDGDTLEVRGERSVLPGEAIRDVTFVGDTLIALVGSRAIGGPYLVTVGPDGLALTTHQVSRFATVAQVVGITAADGTLHAASTDAATGRTDIVAITLD